MPRLAAFTSFALVLLSAGTAAPARAQEQTAQHPALDARAFTPQKIDAEFFVDFARLRELEIWDAMRRSAVGPIFGMAEKEFGFEFEHVETLRGWPEVADGEPRPEGQRRGGILIWTGDEKVQLPPVEGMRNRRADKLAGYDTLIEDRWNREATDPDVWLLVRPGLLVYGTRHLVEPPVTGAAKPGVPGGELLSLTSGKGGLAHVVVKLSPKAIAELPFPLPDGVLQEDDPLRYLALRLVSEPQPDGEEAHVVLSGTLRCENGTKGPAAVETALRAAIDAAKQHPRLGALKRYWNKIELKVDGIDLVARLPLGRPREAAAHLAQMLAPLAMFAMAPAAAAPRAEAAAPVPVEPARQPPPAPAPAPQPGQRGGQQP